MILKRFSQVAAAALVAVLAGAPGAGAAEKLIGTYTARISPSDLRTEDGFHIKSPSQAIVQDRANVHGRRFVDPQDQFDPFFETRSSRERLQRMLDQPGVIDLRTREAILRGDSVIQVQVYKNKVGVRLQF